MLFTPFKPMEPVAAPSVPQGERFLYQVKWDGVRLIAHSGGGRLMLHNRKLHERTEHYPELGCLKSLCASGAIFDGEVVALKQDRPSFPLVLRRDLALPCGAGAMLRMVNQIPICYLVFDLIYFNGQDLTRTSLSGRQELLAEVLPENEHIHRVESFRDGILLFEAAREKCLEGIVAKEKESLYAMGGKLSAWLKIKIRRKQLAAVGGYTRKAGRINSLLAGAYLSGHFIYLGRVANGLSACELAELAPFLETTKKAVSPFVNKTAGKGQVWVEPRLAMLVEFQEWTEDLRMRQPVVKGFTKDRPEDCALDSG